MANIKCKVCNKEFKRYGKQILTAKTCSFKCLGEYNKATPNTQCSQCLKWFHMKESQKKRYKRSQGYFCSTTCVSDFRKIEYLGDNNPNFRAQVTRDTSGYLLTYLPSFGRIRLHHKVAFETLLINKIPKGYCIHHRDCQVDNNSPENLALLTLADHRWLHKQFGNACLWAYSHNKISKEELMSWTNDKERASVLLDTNIVNQGNLSHGR